MAAESSEISGYRRGDPEYRRIELALFIAAFVSFAQMYETQVLLPEISEHFHLDPSAASLTVSLTTAGLALALFLVGPSSERLGRRPIILTSILVTSLVGMVLGFAPTWHLLLTGRFLQGIAAAGLPAVATAYLAEEVRPRDLPRAAGVYIAGTGLGGLFGRILSGVISHFLPWHWVLTVIGVAGVLFSLLVWRLLPPQENFQKSPPGIKTLIAHTKAVLSEPGLALLFLIGALTLGAYQAVFNMVPYRFSAAPYLFPAWIVSGFFLVNAFGSLSASVSGNLVARYGRRRVMPLAALLTLIGLVLTIFETLWIVIPALIIFAIGFFAVHATASGWVTARAVAGVGAAGQAASAYSISYYLGGSCFGTVGGIAWYHWGWSGLVALTATLIALVVVFALLLRKIPPLQKSGY